MEAAEQTSARSDTQWSPSCISRGDEVERSLELLDRVLSEFDDLENGNVASLEDDGYMSMNGRRQQQLQKEFPPPPAEEAQRIISTLLPRVSPSNSSKVIHVPRQEHTSLTLQHSQRFQTSPATIATQTTIPKTRHLRPYGWQNGAIGFGRGNGGLPPRTVAAALERHREVRRKEESRLSSMAEVADGNFSDDSLDGTPPPPPPPPAAMPASKRGSIAWEVPLDDDEALYTPGSTKVIGRRRRRSTDRSSSGSMSRLRDSEEWPDPPTGTEDGSISPLSDSSHLDSSISSKHEDIYTEIPDNMTSTGTYVIRKGRLRERKPMPLPSDVAKENSESKRTSTTFDNIKCLLKEGLIEGLDEAPPDFSPPNPPAIVRVVSLPAISSENSREPKYSGLDTPDKTDDDTDDLHVANGLDSLPPNETDSDSEKKHTTVLVNGATDTSSNEALIAELKKEYDTESLNNNDNESTEIVKAKENLIHEEILGDPWIKASEISQVQVIQVMEEMVKEDDIKETENAIENEIEVESKETSIEKPPREFKVKVEVVQHEFGPLPPSPVEEEDEYSDVLRPSPVQTPRGKNSEKRDHFYRCLEQPGSDPLGTKFLNKSNTDHHIRDGSSSLKTRSMDAGFTRNHHIQQSASRREVPGERRTLPTELQGPSKRRTFQKRGGSKDEGVGSHMQVSCSLPETPIFTRGCDIPRTPHRRAPDVPVVSRTTPRQMPSSSNYRNTGMSLNEAMTGTELLRLAGGPARGWYPRHRQPRPASVEQLDRLNHHGLSPGSLQPPSGPWDPSRKPQTLPPNLTPKFFHRSPREALRRVTSLLIRRGNSKDKKDALSPTSGFTGESGEGSKQKKGFFRNFWKKSRHYSLEQQ